MPGSSTSDRDARPKVERPVTFVAEGETRSERRKRQNREALIEAGHKIMT
jgi:hypothetical protein